MEWLSKTRTDITDFLMDHPRTRQWLRWIGIFFVEILSAFIFAYELRALITPTTGCVEGWKALGDTSITDADIASPVHLISGGASGIGQTIDAFINIFTNTANYETIIISVSYFAVNIPIMILSWFKISKQFTVFTLINVGLVSLFNYVIPDQWIYQVINLYNDYLARTIFAGLLTGISSGLAMMVGTSSGGIDVITVYLSEKKSTSVGKYSLTMNTTIVIFYVLFSVMGIKINPSWNTQSISSIVTMALYTIIYFFISSKVVDLLNTKNRKQEIQIFTNDEQLPLIMVHSFPHTCTIVESKGAFTGKKNMIVYMVISRSEKKKAIKMINSVDPKSFVTVTDIEQVYGRFYIKPFE